MLNTRPSANRRAIAIVTAIAVLTCGSGYAADASRLGADLTPSGAERAAGKDGVIPAWPGNVKQDSGWTYGKYRGDFFVNKADKPLYEVDASNVDKYADKLSAGEIALIKGIKSYKMEVYPTRRSCGVPDFVAENTKKNVGFAKLNANGWAMQDAWVPGYPFPIPDNGIEAIWNSKLRYRGVATEYKSNITSVSPRKGSTEWIRAVSEQTLYFPWAVKGSTQLSKLPQIEYYTYFAYNAPAALAGQALTVSISMDQPGNETFYYFPGQRRVRRMPSYAYDSPQIGMENQYTLDEPFVFNGTPDRFDWKLVGKKEMIVPYNSFGAYDFRAKIDDVEKPDAINPSFRRYELHRVWIVEGTVKSGMRHTAPKRTFYLDEDSWAPLLADDYDAQGKLAKMREGYLIPVYETGTCDVSAFAQYNLNEGRYVFDMKSAGAGKDDQWIVDGNSPRYKPAFYTADNLRAISDR